MKSINKISRQPFSTSILADEIIEFHAARLILLFQLCGTDGKINGLTKMAKLDFFVRYPQFFSITCQAIGQDVKIQNDSVESEMIRYHYGPWDHRYYQILAYLKARGLLEISKDGKAYNITLTGHGKRIATQLEQFEAYASIIEQMKKVNQVLGKMSGTQLKQLVYKVFDEQVSRLKLGEVIK
jgi:hypothetical protein